MEQEQNVMTHYVVDAHGTTVPFISVPSVSSGIFTPPATSNLFQREQTFSHINQSKGQNGNQMEAHLTIINFEQCCVCSIMYEQRRPVLIPQPDLNRMICKVLDVVPEASFFRDYLPVCVNCTNLLRKFDRLRVELEFVKTQLVTYVIESLTQVRAEGGSQLDGLKDRILNRWTDNLNGSNRKGGFIAATTIAEDKSGDLSWAAYNNLTKGSIIGEQIENWNIGSEVTVEAGAIATVPLPSDYEDNGDNLQKATDVSNEKLFSHADGPAINFLSIHENEDETLSNQKHTVSIGRGRVKQKRKKIKRKLQGIGQDVTPLICEKCGRMFETTKLYNAHVQACATDDLGMEKICTICTEEQQKSCIFETWVEFKSHVLQQHSIVRLEICQFCRLRFLPFGVEHHKCSQNYKGQVDKEAIFKCDQCDKAYKIRSNLTDHVRRSHKDQKHSCDTCGKTYGSPMLLKFHVERHKSVVTKFKCSYCGVCLSSNYSLKEHLKRHTGEQPYKCSVPTCGRKFSSKAIFNAHQMVHSDQKPHVCEECGKGFKLRGTMRRHLSRNQLYETNHTKKCPLCPKAAFRKVWILKRHMKAEHPDTAELEEVFVKYKDVDDTPQSGKPNTSTVKPGTTKISLSRVKQKGEKEPGDCEDFASEEDVKSKDEKNEVQQSQETDSQEISTDTKEENMSSTTGSPSRHSARLRKKAAVSKNCVVKADNENSTVSICKPSHAKKKP